MIGDYIQYAFEVKPCDSKATALAEAIVEMLQADKELYEANCRVPNYTGQYSSADVVANEQEAWNRKAEALLIAVKTATAPNLLR